MNNDPEKLSFVPPTTPEISGDPFAHLRVEITKGDHRFDMNPFELFGEIGKDLVAQEDITAEDIVMALQFETGHQLNTPGIRNLLGWANEEITRYHDQEKLEQMSATERINHLYGVEIIFEDPDPARSAA